MADPRAYTPTTIPGEPAFRFTYTGSLTVNVYRWLNFNDGWVNFDAFTLGSEITSAAEFKTECDEWLEYATEADFRYTADPISREKLLHG